LQFGVGVFAAGLVLLVTTFASHGTSVSAMALLLPLVVSGLGMGLVIAPLVDVILAGVPEADAGAASGVLNATGQVGQAIGVAAIGAVFFVAVGAPTPGHYVRALQLSLVVQIVVLVACILLMALMPKRGGGHNANSGDLGLGTGDSAESLLPPQRPVRCERAA
jgi:hypothetical protein